MNSNNRRLNRGHRNRRLRGAASPSLRSILYSNPPTFKGQTVAAFKVTSAPVGLATDSSGNLAVGISADPTLRIVGFANRFDGFEEMRIIKVVFKITPVTASDGMTFFWIQEVHKASPTVADAQTANSELVQNSNGSAMSHRVYTWSPIDFGDLTFTPVNQSISPCALAAYTAGNLGSPSSTVLFNVQMIFTLQFRGLLN